MTSADIRRSFLDFFREKKHTIVPSSSLLPDSPNLLFTNAGMNQFVPIFLGQAPCPYKPARAADTQKCIRAGGKHNDLEDVGFDTYHHTFFEMLGNWSFGDYFKKEAIAWAWELVVGRWNFPASRIYATVYKPGPGDPASFDQEAHDEWAKIFRAAGLDPAIHIVNGNKKDNFWMMGDTGPCGPCSELHVDLTPGPRDLDEVRQRTGRMLVNKGDARCIEIWNLVFIQFNANPDGSFVDLPAKHVDTGMGFERVTSMIQGTKGLTDFSEKVKISNYETDVFRPIFDELEKLTGKTYMSTLPEIPGDLDEAEATDVAFRVIADHLRTLSFSIADGILPSNEGRGYVLRRILRRAVRYGRNLGLPYHFLCQLVPILASQFKDIFPELNIRLEIVSQVIARESNSFGNTLDQGVEIFEQAVLTNEKVTPLVVETRVGTRRLSEAFENFHGKTIRNFFKENRDIIDQLRRQIFDLSTADTVRFFGKDILSAQKLLSRIEMLENSEVVGDLIKGGERFKEGSLDQLIHQLRNTLTLLRAESASLPGLLAFKLYDTYGFPLDLTELMARERGLTVDITEFNRLMDEQRSRGKAAQKKEVVGLTTQTEYTDDRLKFERPDEITTGLKMSVGTASIENFVPNLTQFYAPMGGQVGDTGFAKYNDQTVQIVEVQKAASAIVHILSPKLQIDAALNPLSDIQITLILDVKRRARIEGHHSGTHVLHWALRKVLGPTIGQKGSYVGPDRLRFDFSHGAAMTPAQVAEVEALVNERIAEDAPVTWNERPYAEVKGDPSILQFFGDKYGETVRVVTIGDFSRELCGGTHVKHAAQIGYFKILSEGAIAAGIRRIEAASGVALAERLRERAVKQDEAFAALRVRKGDLVPLTAIPADAKPEVLAELVEVREDALRAANAAVAQHEKEHAKAAEADFHRRASAQAAELIAAAREVGGIPFIAHQVAEGPAAYLPVLADALKSRWQGVAVLAAAEPGKVALLCGVAPAFAKKIQAGKVIQAIAPLVGGKGGGRPELAQGGGTNPEGVAAALAKAEELVGAAAA